MDHWGTKRSEMMRLANNHTTSERATWFVRYRINPPACSFRFSYRTHYRHKSVSAPRWSVLIRQFPIKGTASPNRCFH